jgi:MarR family 2-MHQ and catechol resistance regulon transcriptional repressor
VVWTDDELELAGTLEAVVFQVLCSQAESDLNTLVDNDLSISQLRCLLAVAQHGRELAIHTLAQQLGMTLATAGRAVDRLVAHELVLRREDPGDRRVRQVSLSDKGRQIVSGIDEARRRALLAFVRSLPEADATRLLAALRPIAGATNLVPPPRLEGKST